PEASKIKEPFARAREGHTHPIEEINDRWRHLAHRFCRRLAGKKVAAINRIVKMFPGGIAFAFCVDCAINTALRADGVGALDGNNREKINCMARFSDLHCRRKACKPATDNSNLESITCH